MLDGRARAGIDERLAAGVAPEDTERRRAGRAARLPVTILLHTDAEVGDLQRALATRGLTAKRIGSDEVPELMLRYEREATERLVGELEVAFRSWLVDRAHCEVTVSVGQRARIVALEER